MTTSEACNAGGQGVGAVNLKSSNHDTTCVLFRTIVWPQKLHYSRARTLNIHSLNIRMFERATSSTNLLKVEPNNFLMID